MKSHRFLVGPLTTALLVLLLVAPAFAQTVTFPDPNLEAAVRDALGIPAPTPITVADMATLDELIAGNMDIADLTGLEHAVNLTNLSLWDNQISDLGPLQNLTALQMLDFSGNQISDLGPLQNLTNLRTLYLVSNQVSDLGPLQNLTNLNALDLDDNQISDLSPLQNLTNLWELRLSSNQISDLGPLQNLSALTYLSLGNNNISDLGPLQNLTNMYQLDLDDNQVSDLSPLQNMSNLGYLSIEDNPISDISVLQNLAALGILELNDLLIDNDDLPYLYGLDQLWLLDLSGNAGITCGSAVQALADNLDGMDCEDIDWDGECGVDPAYTLTVTKAGTGSGTVTSTPAGINCGADCAETYTCDQLPAYVALAAAPAAGSTFAGWSGDCDVEGGVTVDADKTCTATFELIPAASYTLTVVKAGTGSGTVTSTPAGINCGADCSEAYEEGTYVALAAAPAAGSTFAGWGGACDAEGGVTVDADKTCTATFTAAAPPPVVPEASTLLLLGSGAAGLASYAGLQLRARRRKDD